jgi:Predicted nuclease of the RecB family
MSDLKLFRVQGGALTELDASSSPLEKSLQVLFEKNLEVLLGVRFLASEYVTTNGGRIDTLGIDENGCPVIIEYKRDRSENVINQGLFYLDWLGGPSRRL